MFSERYERLLSMKFHNKVTIGSMEIKCEISRVSLNTERKSRASNIAQIPLQSIRSMTKNMKRRK